MQIPWDRGELNQAQRAVVRENGLDEAYLRPMCFYGSEGMGLRADEAFFTGTAAEVTPIRTVDRMAVGEGRRGPVTESLQKAYFDIIEGRVEDRFGWLEII
mgnify:CR=1 FL=1